ncbi:MAG: hypothetical protein AAGU75_01655 [Bacillota bacterium]
MKRNVLYIISIIVIALPWLFLFEVWPIPYYKLSTFAEVLIEGTMFVLLMIVLSLLKKDLKRSKTSITEKNRTNQKPQGRMMGKILFVLTSLTVFVVGLVLLLIGISFSL